MDTFSELMKLRDLMSKWNFKKTPSHVEKMEILSYLLFTKELIVKTKNLNVIFAERIMCRISRFCHLLKQEQNNWAEAFAYA